MSKLGNMKQTKEAKQQYEHPIAEVLLTPVSKSTISELYSCSEREARELVAECAMYFPIISLSVKGAGYRRACDINTLDNNRLKKDIKDVKQMLKELNSRIKCLKKRQKPLIAWLKVAEKEEARRYDESKGNTKANA